MSRIGLVAVMAGSILASCDPTAALEAVTPVGEYQRTADISYGPAARQVLDVYRPKSPDGSGTVAVFFHGGSWQSGSKADSRFLAEALTARGVLVVIPDYRVYPEVQFPVFIEDAARAIGWAHGHAAEFGGDPRRIFVIGHSAGAHIAALATLDARYLRAVGLTPRDVAGVIGIAGPYDFLPLADSIADIFAAAADPAATQPISFAGPGAPPMLLLHGQADVTVYPGNSTRLAAKLRDAGSPVRLVLYPGLGHLDIMLGLSSVLAGDGRMMNDIMAFLNTPL